MLVRSLIKLVCVRVCVCGEGGGAHIQRAAAIAAASAVVSLQRPPPPLVFSVGTEEQERKEIVLPLRFSPL